jgi:hypothetical protein
MNKELYSIQKLKWPTTGNCILANYDEHSIVVYQAYNSNIAEQIVKSQNFHSDECVKAGYNMNRMTWIKTNFLWMMFRCGWASKANQERVLAIRITRKGFEELLSNAVGGHSRTNGTNGPEAKRTDQVRLQWDPDHLPNGNKVDTGRRAIQLGLRGDVLDKLSKEFIVDIKDITHFVLEQSQNVENESELIIPKEEVYPILDQNIIERINLTQ